MREPKNTNKMAVTRKLGSVTATPKRKSGTAKSVAVTYRVVTEVEQFLREQADFLEAAGHRSRADEARTLAEKLDANYDARELRKKPSKRKRKPAKTASRPRRKRAA